MAEYIANALQTVALGQNVIFDDVACACGQNDVVHRTGSGLFTIHGRRRYMIAFSANISGGTAGTEVSLAVAINGEPVNYSAMASTPAVADDFNNVATTIFITVPCNCCYTVSIQNVGSTAIEVQNANLVLKREA